MVSYEIKVKNVTITVFAEFPNCVGVIDCTHIPVRPPKEWREQFICHHRYYSINVQMVVNHRGVCYTLLKQMAWQRS